MPKAQMPKDQNFRDDKPRQMLRTKEAAAYAGLEAKTLERWRVHGGGPVYSKIGGRVVYDVADLNAFIDACKRRHTSESAGGAK